MNNTNLPTLAIAMINAAAFFAKYPEANEIVVSVAEGFNAYIRKDGSVSCTSKY